MFRMFVLIMYLIYTLTNAEIILNKHPLADNKIEEDYEKSINAVRDYARKNEYFFVSVKDLIKDYSLEFNAIVDLRSIIDDPEKKFYFESDTPVNFTNIQEIWIEQFKDIKNGKIDDSQKLKIPMIEFMTMCCDSKVQRVGCAKQFNQTAGVYQYYCLFSSGDGSSFFSLEEY